MSQTTDKLTMTLAGLALASLPVLVNAQATSPHQTKPKPTTRQHQTAVDHNSPQQHLNEAKRALTSINANTLKGEARSQISEIRTHFTQLESAWRAHMQAAHSGAADHGAAHPSETQARGTAGSSASGGDWMSHYSAIDQILSQMTDANPRLMDFRKHLDAFHTAAMSATGTPHGAADPAVPAVPDDFAARARGVESNTQVDAHPHPGTPNTPAPTDSNAQFTVAPGQTIQLNASPNADSATLARLSGMIDEMLRGAAPATATGTTGSVAGAAPTAAGTVCVDRAKLEQLRTVIDGMRSQQQ
jgi:hypothetical protein